MGCYLPWGCLFLVLSIVYSRFPSSSGCIMEERAALMDISSWIVSIKSEVPSSWENGDDCCSWKRIMCDNSTRRILRLDLSQIYQPNASYGSDGSTSAEADVPCFNLNMTIFSSFRELQLLDFSGNYACLQNFNGLQGLRKLKYLNLSDNTFIESIPVSIRKLVSLEVINLRGNNMSGALQNTAPGSLFGGGFDGMDFSYSNHYDLQGFTFTTKWNSYTYGRNFFMSMSGIDLSANMLSGEIPMEIGNLSHIKSLNLSNNFFTGSIPATFANLSEIESLDLSENRLNGSIPRQLTRLSSLEVFSVAYNNLSGCLPDSGQFGAFGMDSYRGNSNLRSCTSSSGPVAWNGTVGNVADDTDPILYVVSAVSFVLAFWATVTFVFCHSFGQRVILNL
ncbi:hypothetical protein ACQ4PT_052706 [Festuca glaucescens]